MALNISGSLISSEIVREYEYNSIIKDGLSLHLDPRISETISGTTWYDFSGNNYTGSLLNGVSYDSDDANSFSFDGVDDIISISKPNPPISGFISICVWVKFDNYTSSPIIVHKGSHFTFQMRNDQGTDKWTYADSSTYSYATFGYRTVSGLYDAGNWMFLTITKDSSFDVRLYKNGTLVDTRTNFGGAISDVSSTLWLSGYSDTDSQPTNNQFDGNLGQLFIYNRTLSSNEISYLYDVTKKRYGH